ncbi:hypothetical protein AMTRI_Chr02g213090 [Amborella trichopoda]
MGCFFGCFRAKEDDRPRGHLISEAVSSKSRDHLVSQNPISSAFIYSSENNKVDLSLAKEGKSSPGKDPVISSGNSKGNNVAESDDDLELRNEVKFLKSCGALLETPMEIRKAYLKPNAQPHAEDAANEFHSWLPSSSCRQLHWDDQNDQFPTFHISDLSPSHSPKSTSDEQKLSERKLRGSPRGSGVQSILDTVMPSREFSTINSKSDSLTNPSTSPIIPSVGAMQTKNRSVRFACDEVSPVLSDKGSISSENSPSKNNEVWTKNSYFEDHKQSQPQIANYSPYPTPLKLSDEMQTPGTVFPNSHNNLLISKNVRIRSQYVYPVLNPVENLTQWMTLKADPKYLVSQPEKERSNSEKMKIQSQDNKSGSVDKQYVTEVERHDSIEKISAEKLASNEEFSIQNGMRCAEARSSVESSLSDWLKPSQNNGLTVGNGKPNSVKSSDSDRPILGTVAAFWNDCDEVPTSVSPKSWDGNGIPNSTNKYKEDQKVSWHATPFEERLEKALSNENLYPQRKLMNFEEGEEYDTAAS